MPHGNRDRRHQKRAREAITPRRHHEVEKERVVDQTNENGELKAEAIRNAAAQKITNENIPGSAEQRRQAQRDRRQAEGARRHPNQQRIKNMIVREGMQDVAERRFGGKPEIRIRLILSEGL